MAIAMISVLILAACAGGVKDKEITVENVVVSGDAKDLVKVVDGVYTLKNARDMLSLTVEFELLEQEEMAEEDVEEVEEMQVEMLGPWTLTLLDAGGAAIPNMEAMNLVSNDEVKILDLLNEGEASEKVMVTFEKAIPNKDDIKDIVEETGTFEIMTALTWAVPEEMEEEEVATTTQTTTPKPPAEQPATPSTDWDKELDKYESLVNRMIVLHRKVTQGDPTAMPDYLKIKEQAESLDKKLEDATDMNDAQMARFLNLQKKMLNALVS